MHALSVWIHIVAACAWVGSMIFFAVALVPVLRSEALKSVAPLVIRKVGPRFRWLGLVSLALLLVTGTTNLWLRGVGLDALGQLLFWRSPFGRALAWKLLLVLLVWILTALHDVVSGKTALETLRRDPTSPAARRTRFLASSMGRAMLILSLGIVFCASALVRGGF